MRSFAAQYTDHGAKAQALGSIKNRYHIPLVADIHFDYRLAISAIRKWAQTRSGINPGIIRSRERVQAVVDKAKRIWGCLSVWGVNSGSLEKELVEKYGKLQRKGWWKVLWIKCI